MSVGGTGLENGESAILAVGRIGAPTRMRDPTYRCARVYSGTRARLNAAASELLTGGSTVEG